MNDYRIRGLKAISLAFAKSLDPCLPENDLENTEDDCILDEFLEEESNSNDNTVENFAQNGPVNLGQRFAHRFNL
jgi:hypothetical protein